MGSTRRLLETCKHQRPGGYLKPAACVSWRDVSRRKALRNLASSNRRFSLGVEGLKGGTAVALPVSSTATMVK